ncbi:Conserved protein of unknown function, PE-PGRS family protein, PE-PGRS 45 (part1) [Mycobacterium canettii CIPT 140060008]|nr:Conserved protein of unknown function, PE-PGRS family protein, PE-PGRS 45 (part1) [Mycobacterium canettii CIPT 140060008]
MLAAAHDEVSTAIAALFGSHGQHYQAISAQVAAYQQRFVLALSQAGSTYAVAKSGQRNTAAERARCDQRTRSVADRAPIDRRRRERDRRDRASRR